MADRTLRVAVVGVGGIGHYHVRLWRRVAGAELLGIFDLNDDTARRVGRELDVPTLFPSLEAAVADDRVDIVDVCTPNMRHKEPVIAALEAGKHCICEKPLAATAADIQEMMAARDRAGRLLMTCQHMRFEPRTAALRTLVQAGRLGEVYYTRAWWLRRRMAPTSPGLLTSAQAARGPGLDLGVHVLDLALHLLGHPQPTTVSGYSTRRLAHQPDVGNQWGAYDPALFEVEDFAAGLVRFANGSALSLEVSWLLNMIEHELRGLWLHGTAGGAQWPELGLSQVQEGLLLDSHITGTPEGNGHVNAFSAFAEAVRTDGPSPVPAEESLIVARVLEALYASAESGGEVVLEPAR